MFSNPTVPDRNQDEARILQVDATRLLCKVRTSEGRVLESVQVLSPYGGSSRYGDRFLPKKGDRAVINYGLGYPVIIGFLPRQASLPEASPSHLAGPSAGVDTGSYMPETYATVPDPNKPGDLLAGDRVITGDLGNSVGILKGGSVLLRASRMSEILLSKLGLLVRVVSKNWAHFSDSFSDVSRNFGNRLYRYVGYSVNYPESLTEGYRYHQIIGDVVAGEALTTRYDSISSAAPAGPSVFKEKVTDPSGATTFMFRTIGLNGDEEVWVNNGSTFTRMKATAGVITLSFNDQHTITIDSGKINCHHSGGADVVLDANGVRSTFGNGTINMASSSVTTTYSGGQVKLEASQVSATHSGHFVIISSSGVAIG